MEYFDILKIYILEHMIIATIVAAGLAFIPATIAKNKGYRFGLWWLYGWLVFIIAFVHALCLKDKTVGNVVYNNNLNNNVDPNQAKPDLAKEAVDELKEYKKLLDSGLISEEEFQTVKEKLIKII